MLIEKNCETKGARHWAVVEWWTHKLVFTGIDREDLDVMEGEVYPGGRAMLKSKGEQNDGRINTGSMASDEEHSKIRLQYSPIRRPKYLTIQYDEDIWCDDKSGTKPGRDHGSLECFKLIPVKWSVLL